MAAKPYTILVLMTATEAWLSLSRAERAGFVERTLGPIFARYEGRVSLRTFDAEAFSARCSDVAMFEAEDLRAYYYLMEELRDTALFGQPYFRVNEIIPCIEGGFAEFEAQA
ncbi:MAG TPA: darcynin family protein [Herpetosiphonaceae bacterium]